MIDTSPIGNLRTVALQLSRLSAAPVADPEVIDRLRLMFTLDAAPPPFAPHGLSLDGRGRDDVIEGVPEVARDAVRALNGAGPDAAVAARLIAELQTALDRLPREVEQLRLEAGAAFGASPTLLDLAERLCLLHTAAAALHLWWFNRDLALWGESPVSPGWLIACLQLLLARAAGAEVRTVAGTCAPALDRLLELRAERRLFSSVPIPLAGAALAAQEA
jgi:hypothetical protein